MLGEIIKIKINARNDNITEQAYWQYAAIFLIMNEYRCIDPLIVARDITLLLNA
jgi:hypothetical protein